MQLRCSEWAYSTTLSSSSLVSLHSWRGKQSSSKFHEANTRAGQVLLLRSGLLYCVCTGMLHTDIRGWFKSDKVSNPSQLYILNSIKYRQPQCLLLFKAVLNIYNVPCVSWFSSALCTPNFKQLNHILKSKDAALYAIVGLPDKSSFIGLHTWWKNAIFIFGLSIQLIWQTFCHCWEVPFALPIIMYANLESLKSKP